MTLKMLLSGSTLATLVLAGCASDAGSGAGTTMHSGHGAGAGSSMGRGHDMTQMCAMHRQMMDGKTPAEQQAAIEAYIKSRHGGAASTDHAQRHRDMMDKRCAAPSNNAR